MVAILTLIKIKKVKSKYYTSRISNFVNCLLHILFGMHESGH